MRQGGLSLVELLVGTAIGLVVAAAAATVLSGHLSENHRAGVQARLEQDLRNAIEGVGGDLRRAGYWAAAASGVRGADGSEPLANPYGFAALGAGPTSAVRLSYARAGRPGIAVDDAERFGFRLRAGVLEMELGNGNWQAISDVGSMRVTAFVVEPHSLETSLAAFCDRPCAATSTTCPPRQQVRSFEVTLTARSTSDAGLVRSLHSSVRTRNDGVLGSCAG